MTSTIQNDSVIQRFNYEVVTTGIPKHFRTKEMERKKLSTNHHDSDAKLEFTLR